MWRNRSARGLRPVTRDDDALDLGGVVVPAAGRGRLGERLEVGLHVDDLGHRAEDRPLDLLGDRVRLVERKLAGQLEVERHVDAVAASITDRLWISRTRETDIAASRTRSRSAASAPAGSTWTTTSLPGSARVHRGLDAVGDGVALADGGAGRDADHDVGERAARRLAQPQPAHLDRRVEPADRGARRAHGVGRRAVHEHVDVAADQPSGGEDDEERDEERGDRVAVGPARPHREQAAEHGERAERGRSRSGARSRQSAALVVPPRGAERDDGARDVDHDHDADRGEHPPGGRRRSRSSRRAARPRALPTATLTSTRNAASASAARCSALPWP